jgi:hypothetical protein
MTLLAAPLHAQRDTTFTRADTLRGSIGPGRAWWDVTYYNLDVAISLRDSSVRGATGISYTVIAPSRDMQIDLQTPMEIDSIVQGGQKLRFRRDGNAFFVTPAGTQATGSRQSLTVYFHGRPRVAMNAPWDGGFVWKRDSLGAPYIATAVQGLGASAWWANKDTQADEPDSQRVAIRLPNEVMDVSNGRLRSVKQHADGTTTWEWFVAKPINNYNVAVQAAKYAHLSDVYDGEGGQLTLDYYPLAYHAVAAKKQLPQVPAMMRCFEKWFGPYPWYEDGFKLVETPHLGMEHQSAVAYGNRWSNGYLGRDLSGTGWGMTFDFIIIHETAHEWWGNNITSKDIADMWVHESFGNYSENLFVECEHGKQAGAAYVIGTRKLISNDAPIVGTFGVHNEGSGDMYYKGGNMLHTIRQIVNDDEKWRGVLRGLNATFRHQTVTGDQVRAFISERAGVDLSTVFQQYLTTTRVPMFEYRVEGGKLMYRWADVVPGFTMPVRVSAGGAPMLLRPTDQWQTAAGNVRDAGAVRVDENFYVVQREVRASASTTGKQILRSAQDDNGRSVQDDKAPRVSVYKAARRDKSARLVTAITASSIKSDAPRNALAPRDGDDDAVTSSSPTITVPAGSKSVEQTTHGTRPAPAIVASFDGLGEGFKGPQGSATLRNPSDNTLAVGLNHVMQIVNSRMAIFNKKGDALYGPVPTNVVFKGFGGPCEARPNGDAVARYDQLANRWLIVMPLFRRSPRREREPSAGRDGEPARRSEGKPGQPGAAVRLYEPTAAELAPTPPQTGARPPADSGSYGMCYAISTGTDPFGPYYRYEFVRPLFPDYPRPAVWPDGYYVPTSTGDDVIQKHACVVDRAKMLRGEDATEQCVIIDGVNFLNNADLDGTTLPPKGAPNVMLAAGGKQLAKQMEDSVIYAWTFHVDWKDTSKTRVSGPIAIPVAPYHYLCDGQLTNCVSQPGTDRRLDAQGDKLMARVTYRRIGDRESIVATHSVNTAAGAGGVRWYELRVGAKGALTLAQQGTFAPDSSYRWMASPAMDRNGNIGIGYSFGGVPHFAGQRFAGRLRNDPPGTLSLKEAVLVEGEAAQTNTLRWEDYTQTAIDPSDDCTIWYVGDYLKLGATNYSSRIGAFRLPGCTSRR